MRKGRLYFDGVTYAILVLVNETKPGLAFWQQASPCYFRRGNALRFARKNGIILEGHGPQEKSNQH